MMTDTYVNIAAIFAVLGYLTFLYCLYLRNDTFIDTRTQDTIVVPHFDYVLMLPDWEDSKGARMEYDVADICGISITFYCNHFSKLLP